MQRIDKYPAKVLSEINRSSSILRDIFDNTFTGIHIDNDEGNLIVGSWGAVMEGWGTPELKGSLKSINIHTKKIKNLGKKPIGNLDGIESDGKGSYLVTDWTGAKLYRIKKNGKYKVLAEVGKGAADHEVILDKNLIIIPVMAEGKVVALKVK